MSLNSEGDLNELTVCQLKYLVSGLVVVANPEKKAGAIVTTIADWVDHMKCPCNLCKPKKPSARSLPPPDWAIYCSNLLARKVGVKASVPWARQLVLMREEVDELREADEDECQKHVEAGIEWLYSGQNEGEFAFVVKSGKSLRAKWTRIVESAKRNHEYNKPQVEYDEWMLKG